jgi:5'-deoxynucleotidase YfbR-like HD superfamily hydrolase
MESSEIRTYSGKLINVFDLQVEDIDIIDICVGLSNIPRFAGQAEFYSVARHSIEVCEMLPKEYKLAGLLHDASEAYIGDMPTPIKQHLPDYLSMEKRIMEVVNKKFGINVFDEKVKQADHASFIQEAKVLWSDSSRRENTDEIRKEFLRLFYAYL